MNFLTQLLTLYVKCSTIFSSSRTKCSTCVFADFARRFAASRCFSWDNFCFFNFVNKFDSLSVIRSVVVESLFSSANILWDGFFGVAAAFAPPRGKTRSSIGGSGRLLSEKEFRNFSSRTVQQSKVMKNSGRMLSKLRCYSTRIVQSLSVTADGEMFGLIGPPYLLCSFMVSYLSPTQHFLTSFWLFFFLTCGSRWIFFQLYPHRICWFNVLFCGLIE